MNWKETYTKLFLKELGKSTNETAVKEYMPLWWKNNRDNIPYPRDVPLSTQVIIHLDKFIDCPYYLTNRSIVVTNEKKAVELTLFSGDLRKYGLTKAVNRQKKS